MLLGGFFVDFANRFVDRRWIESWADAAAAIDGVVPFEALNELSRREIPMLEVRDSL